ncbi:ArgE/DapE family deacylase [Helcococcus kunzii]|uniref:ArgE/DapE family deacylase n=1 Tax=Helcococcus kunzii TaxID=40091 RepID=UPI0021A76426|nr:ArgE/DapE family deacylase [Helcococcus kunzii]MCT1796948.1 ArgE/DapE family deacylase [Helcococcus kunzii]MCT1988494.1 ArgE/DapE family deacylase [Helcococcus kunzii]
MVEFDEGRCSLVAEISNGEGKTLAISGHMDVVNAGNEEEWDKPPYAGIIKNDVIWGRGASDMKSGLAALVLAMIDLHNSKKFKGKIRLLATVGEEIGELGSKQLTDEGHADNIDAMLIGEPVNIGIVYAHKGSLNYKVTSKGLAAHSSAPETGNNAIENLLKLINEITVKINENIEKYVNKVLGKTIHNITLVKGGTQVNSIPDYAEYEANARTIPEYSSEDVINDIQNIINQFNKESKNNFELIVTANQAPVETKPDSELIKVIQEVVNDYEDIKPKNLIKSMEDLLDTDLSFVSELLGDAEAIQPIAVSGTTDAAQFIRANKDIELAVFGPGVPVLNHKINERMPLSQYLDFIEAYKMIFEKYLS